MDRLVQADNSKKRKDVVYNVGGAGCNCTDKPGCQVNGTLKSQNVVYQASVTSEGKEESYIGLTFTESKTRFRNHKSSFSVPDRRNRVGGEVSHYLSSWNGILEQENRTCWQVQARKSIPARQYL